MKQNIERTFNEAEPPLSAVKPGWTGCETASLQRYWNDGLTTAEIASRLGKTVRAVECKIYKLRARGCVLAARRRAKTDHHAGGGCLRGGQAAQRARRRCLYCGEDFDSSHHGNRLCPGCLEDGPFTSAMV